MTDALPLPPIAPVDPSRAGPLRQAVDGKAKPVGALGRLEDLAVRLALIAGTPAPRIGPATLILFAGDHGLVQEGVSRYPSAVTTVMTETLLEGRATANAFARVCGAEVVVVDAGIAAPLPDRPDLVQAALRRGTRNAAREPALTPDEVRRGLEVGARLAADSVARGADAVALGEMGIGNTASAALLVHRLAPAPLAACIGPGAGQDEAGLARKAEALARAAARSDAVRPFDVLCEFGGCEIVMMAGAVIGAAASGRPVVIDGFIATAAALAAIRLRPEARDYCVFAHRSAERGHAIALAALGADPLLDLGMRLGEGTGALLALPLLRAAASLLSDVADLSEVLGRARDLGA